MPLNEELVLNDAVVIEFLADSRHELLHVGVTFDEELNQGLEEVNHTEVWVLVSQRCEDALESIPMLRYVAMGSKNGAHADVHLVFASDVQLELLLAYLSKDFVCAGRVAQVSLLISDKGLELLAGGNCIIQREKREGSTK